MSKVELEFKELSDEQIREAMGQQRWLEDNADCDYDAYVNKQYVSDWFKEKLWGRLSFKLK